MTDPSADADPDLAALLADLADDFRHRLTAGDDPDPDEYAARHPAAADAIRKVLAVVRLTPIAPAEPGPPELSDFKIIRPIGHGGMGVVYEAEQLSLRRRVALKVLPFAALVEPRLRKRFENEARAAAALDHPHVVRVYAVGREGGVHYLAMQLIDGCSLAEVVRAGGGPASEVAATLSPGDPSVFVRRVTELGVQAADALEYAHGLGIVHRDIKPGNLLLDRAGRVWVSDFGLAKVAALDSGVTATGDVFGTLRYMSPEQAQARHDLVDHRTDIYSLGATLYELLAGRPAVAGEEKAEILRGVIDAEPVPLRKLNPAVPRDLETVIEACLRKNPAERYASAKELADDLRAVLAGEPIRRRRLTVVQRTWRRAARRPALVGLAVAVVCVSGLAIGLGLFAAYRGARLDAAEADRRRLQADQERAASELAAAAQREEVQRFHAGLERVRQRRADPQAGWTRLNLDDLRELARLGPAGDFQVELRSEAAAALGAIDLIKAGELGPNVKAYGVDYSPDGRWIAVGDWRQDLFTNCHVRIYDARTHAEVEDLMIGPDLGLLRAMARMDGLNGTREVRFSPAPGKWLAAATRDGRIARWPTDHFGTKPARKVEPWTSDEHRRDPGPTPQAAERILFPPESNRMVTASQWVVRSWTDEAVPKATVVRAHLAGDQWPAGPEVLVSHGEWKDGAAYHWLDTRTGEARRSDLGPLGVGAVGPPGNLVACLEDGNSVTLRRAFGGSVPAAVTTPAGVPLAFPGNAKLFFSPAGGLLVGTVQSENQFFVIDVASARLAAQGTTTGAAPAARFSPDGRQLAVTTFNGTYLFDLSAGVQETVATVNDRFIDVMAAPRDHSKLMVGAHDVGTGGRVYQWNLAEGGGSTLVKCDETNLYGWGTVATAGYEPGGSRFFYVGYAELKQPKFHDVIDISYTARHGAGKFRAAAWGPDGKLWMTCTDELHVFDEVFRYTARFWTNDKISEHDGVVISSMAAGKQFVLLGRNDGRLFRIATANKATESWKVTDAGINAVDLPIDPDVPDDRKQAVIGDHHGRIVLVDVGTGKATPLPTGHRAPVQTVSCGPGFFASGSADGTVRLWLDDGRPLATLRMGGPVRKVLLSGDGKSLLIQVNGERGIRRWRLDRLFAAWRELGLGAALPGQ